MSQSITVRGDKVEIDTALLREWYRTILELKVCSEKVNVAEIEIEKLEAIVQFNNSNTQLMQSQLEKASQSLIDRGAQVKQLNETILQTTLQTKREIRRVKLTSGGVIVFIVALAICL